MHGQQLQGSLSKHFLTVVVGATQCLRTATPTCSVLCICIGSAEHHVLQDGQQSVHGELLDAYLPFWQNCKPRPLVREHLRELGHLGWLWLYLGKETGSTHRRGSKTRPCRPVPTQTDVCKRAHACHTHVHTRRNTNTSVQVLSSFRSQACFAHSVRKTWSRAALPCKNGATNPEMPLARMSATSKARTSQSIL